MVMEIFNFGFSRSIDLEGHKLDKAIGALRDASDHSDPMKKKYLVLLNDGQVAALDSPQGKMSPYSIRILVDKMLQEINIRKEQSLERLHSSELRLLYPLGQKETEQARREEAQEILEENAANQESAVRNHDLIIKQNRQNVYKETRIGKIDDALSKAFRRIKEFVLSIFCDMELREDLLVAQQEKVRLRGKFAEKWEDSQSVIPDRPPVIPREAFMKEINKFRQQIEEIEKNPSLSREEKDIRIDKIQNAQPSLTHDDE